MTYDLRPIAQPQPMVNNKALAWTIGVHALLFLLFFFLRYNVAPTPPPPTVDSGGLEVNLGTSENGSGHNQPMSAKAPAPYQATVVFHNAAAKTSLPKEILHSTDADAPEVENKKHKGAVKPVIDDNKPVPKPQEKPKYTYAGDNGPGGNSAVQNMPGKNEGITHGPGDQGVPGGSPGAANYTGLAGNGTGGIGHTLSGRTISPDHFVAEFHEGGKVVIHVTVDRDGSIVSKFVKSSSSPQLSRLALDELSNAHFSKSTGPEPQQFGDVTIIFKTRQ